MSLLKKVEFDGEIDNEIFSEKFIDECESGGASEVGYYLTENDEAVDRIREMAERLEHGCSYYYSVALSEGLINASKKGRKKVVQLILDRIADSDISPEVIETARNDALFWACCAGHEKAVELLIANGANVRYRADDYLFRCPLRGAVDSGRLKVARVLLKHGAVPTENMFVAALTSHLHRYNIKDMVQSLLDYRPDLKISAEDMIAGKDDGSEEVKCIQRRVEMDRFMRACSLAAMD